MKDIKGEVKDLIDSGYALLYVRTWEEDRARELLGNVAAERGARLVGWSETTGFDHEPKTDAADPLKALARIKATEGKIVFLLKDFHVHIANQRLVRMLRDLVPLLAERGQAVIIVSPTITIPEELEKDITLLDLPLPAAQEMSKILDAVQSRVAIEKPGAGPVSAAAKEGMVRASLGLTAMEARRVFTRALKAHPSFQIEHVPIILQEKKHILRRTQLLEFYEVNETLQDVGGLDLLKKWLSDRSAAFSEDAREFGLPVPKGLLLLGVQGCGKSLCAKAVSTLWQMPLLRLDLASVLSAAHDSGETGMRRSIQIAESIEPCVLWIDEIEKGFASHLVSGHSEQGSVARAFATFLTWLQEKTEPVYVFATANSIADLPPELVRKGRFDDIFFVDLPMLHERKHIFKIHLQKRKRDPEAFDLEAMAQTSEGFSGSEIEQAIISAMYEAFTGSREVLSEDILRAIKATVPLSETLQEKIQELRDWAKTRARPASLDTTLMDLLETNTPRPAPKA